MSSASTPQQPPIVNQELGEQESTSQRWVTGSALLADVLLVSAWIALTDWLLYQVGSYFSWSIFLLSVVPLFAILKRTSARRIPAFMIAIVIVALAIKLAWCGSVLQIACGIVLVLCYAMSTSGIVPFFPEVVAFGGLACSGAVRRILRIRIGSINSATGEGRPYYGSSIWLPALFVALFATLFVFANPDLLKSVGVQLQLAFNSISKIFGGVTTVQILFWIASGWLILGLLYPSAARIFPECKAISEGQTPQQYALYAAFRNTLLALIVLFASYLVFEFSTLWFRRFPKDFYYAGYAHQGALWLTLALALATCVLSLVFRSGTLIDPRIKNLKRLGLTWSALNFLLAIAVYNRLFIYIHFNGMTRMRVIGLLGVTAVALGFVLVVIKVHRNHGFVWLLHRQLWVPVICVVSYAVLPVDWTVNRYNVSSVLAGNPAASVQVIAHRTSAEGMLPVCELVDSDDTQIREGSRALLALWAEELRLTNNGKQDASRESIAVWTSQFGHFSPWVVASNQKPEVSPRAQQKWHQFQGAELLLANRLQEIRDKWLDYSLSKDLRDSALNDLFRHTYQWY